MTLDEGARTLGQRVMRDKRNEMKRDWVQVKDQSQRGAELSGDGCRRNALGEYGQWATKV